MKSSPKKTETIKIRIDPGLAHSFETRCLQMGQPKSEVLRRIMNRWLRETREIERLKS
jgi:hypothetical protein